MFSDTQVHLFLAAPIPVPAKQSPRILLVEDNKDAAASLKMLLETEGYEIRLAHDGEAAVKLALEIKPDVLLVDIGLPTMNGYEVAKQVRRQHRFRKLLVIAVTGWGWKIDRDRSAAAGIDHHLVKPADFNVLKDLIASWEPEKKQLEG
jgi:CheY-like chemotaxis protein